MEQESPILKSWKDRNKLRNLKDNQSLRAYPDVYEVAEAFANNLDILLDERQYFQDWILYMAFLEADHYVEQLKSIMKGRPFERWLPYPNLHGKVGDKGVQIRWQKHKYKAPVSSSHKYPGRLNIRYSSLARKPYKRCDFTPVTKLAPVLDLVMETELKRLHPLRLLYLDMVEYFRGVKKMRTKLERYAGMQFPSRYR